MTNIIVWRIAHIDAGVRIVNMIDQEAMTKRLFVESSLLDILHNHDVAIIICVHQLIGLATFYQRKQVSNGLLAIICDRQESRYEYDRTEYHTGSERILDGRDRLLIIRR